MRDSLHIRPVVQTFSVSSLLVGRNYWTNSRVASDMLRHCNVSKRHVTLFMELNVVSEGRCDWRGLLSTAPSPLVWRFRTSVYAIRRHCLRGICNIFYTKWGNPISYCFIVITKNLNCDMLLTFTTAYASEYTPTLRTLSFVRGILPAICEFPSERASNGKLKYCLRPELNKLGIGNLLYSSNGFLSEKWRPGTPFTNMV